VFKNNILEKSYQCKTYGELTNILRLYVNEAQDRHTLHTML